jgi:hypothetical protein
VDRSRGGLFVRIASPRCFFFCRAEAVDLKRSIIPMGLNPIPAQETSARRNDAQKSIRGTFSPNRFGEADRTAKNVQKLHPTVQIVQIVRELLDGWVIMSLIFYLFLLLWCYPCLLYIFDGAVLSPSTSATECGQNRINKYWSSDIFLYNEYSDQWVGHVRFSALSRQMHLTFLYVSPTTFATSPLLPIGASPSSPSS